MKKIVLGGIFLLFLIIISACGVSGDQAPGDPTETTNPLINFLTPKNGETVEFDDVRFRLDPVAGAEGYAWVFTQNNNILWDTLKDEQRLTDAEYIFPDYAGFREKVETGELTIQVRVRIKGDWSAPVSISVNVAESDAASVLPESPTSVAAPSSMPMATFDASMLQSLKGYQLTWDLTGGGIYLFVLGSGQVTTLTEDSGEAYSWAWSSDGNQLVYQKTSGSSLSAANSASLWMIDLITDQELFLGNYKFPLAFDTLWYESDVDWSSDGQVIATYNNLINSKDGQMIASLSGTVIEHSFSPDGRQLAVIRGDANEVITFYDLEFNSQGQVTGVSHRSSCVFNYHDRNTNNEMEFPCTGQEPGQFSGNGNEEIGGEQIWDIQWSPRGDKIAILADTYQTETDSYVKEIYLVNPDGSRLQNLTIADNLPDVEPFISGVPIIFNWSPEGTKIAFTVAGRIFVADVDSDEVLEITGGEVTCRSLPCTPIWTPDGKWIAFQGDPDKNIDYWFVSPDGSEKISHPGFYFIGIGTRDFRPITEATSNSPALPNIPTAKMPEKDLVAYYPFNGNANDASGNGNDGIVYGTTLVADRFGNGNSAYRFNGTNAIEIPNSESLNLDKDFSIGLWLNVPSANPSSAILLVNKHVASLNDDGSWGLFLQPPGNLMVFSATRTEDWRSVYAWDSFKFNSWHCAFFTYSRDTEIWNFYLDGQPAGNGQDTFNIQTTDLSLYLGAEQTSGGLQNYFQGDMDDVSIYHRALSLEEVNSVCNASPSEAETTPAVTCDPTWSRLGVGKYARVTSDDPASNRVRSEPVFADNVIANISPGMVVKVLEGPVCVNGYLFWKVENSTIPDGFGWTAEGDGIEYWLEPSKNTQAVTVTKASATPKPTATPKPSAILTKTHTPKPTSTMKVVPSATPKAGLPPEKSSWKKLTVVSSLPFRGMQAVYDSARNVIVMFGGTDDRGNTLNQTWEFDGKTWEKQTMPVTPPKRFWHGMAYDSKRNVVVLFGGDKATAENGGGVLNDTWEYNGTDWKEIDTSHKPLPRGNGVLLVFDSCREKTVMFGGRDSRGMSTATWEYDGSDWTQVSTTERPPGRGLSAMVFDPVRCRVVLFGGGDNGKAFNDTWEYDGTDWVKAAPEKSPSGRWGHAMAFNPVTNHAILFGGYTGNTQSKDTWSYDGDTWERITTTFSPSAREQHGMVFDGVNGQVLVINGYGSDGNWAFTEGILQPTPAFSVDPKCALGFSRLKIGDFAQPAGEPSLANRIRSEPKIGNNILIGFTPGMFVKLVDGPVCADGFVFWKVESRFIPGGVGWTAEGDGINYFLEPLK